MRIYQVRAPIPTTDYTRNSGTPGSQSGHGDTIPPASAAPPTNDLYNPNVHQQHQQQPPANAYQQFQPMQPGYASQPPMAFQPPQQPIYQPQQQQQHQFNNNQYQQQQLQATAAARQPTPEPPRAKQPLPEEYVYMQTVFNELRQQCSTAPAANPQLKRKLEDVARRLESLYDLLRDDRVSIRCGRGLAGLLEVIIRVLYRSSPPTR